MDHHAHARDAHATPPLVTVTGILYPSFNEDSENIVGVVLAANDDTEYEIEGGPHINELINLCQEEVTARGRIRFATGRRLLDVVDFEVTDLLRESVQDPSWDPLLGDRFGLAD